MEESLEIATRGYAVINEATRELFELEDLVVALPWKHNELAPHEPRMPPHEYVLEDWCDPVVYRRLEFLIRNHGESFDAYFRAYRRPNRYLEVGAWRYWPTATESERFLNRCRLDAVEPPRRVDEGARPISLEEWGAELPYWPRGSGYGEWKREEGEWVFHPSDTPVSRESSEETSPTPVSP